MIKLRKPTPEELDELACCTVGAFIGGTLTVGVLFTAGQLILKGKDLCDKLFKDKGRKL